MANNSLVFANNCSTTLASPITSATQTTITLTSAANLPTIPPGDQFALTLNDAATQSVFEILGVTAISGSTLTVTRGQDGTTATTWLAGDYAFGSCPRAALANFAQKTETPNFTFGLTSTSVGVSGPITATSATISGPLSSTGAITGASGSFSGGLAAGAFEALLGGYAGPIYYANGTSLGPNTHIVVGATTLTFSSSTNATQTIALSGAAQFMGGVCITFVSTNVASAGLEVSVTGSNTTPVTSLTVAGSFPSPTTATIGVAYLAIGE